MDNDNGKLTDSPLPPKEKKLPKWAKVFIDIAIVTVTVGSLSVLANITYLNVTYNSPFFVNGMSMYPTLNHDGLRKTNDGYRPLTWDDRANQAGDIVDFGYCKIGERKDWRESLARYDILITYYASDFDASGNLFSHREQKIKRLIGLPGETIRFEKVQRKIDDLGQKTEKVGENPWEVVEEYSLDYNPAWGKTTIIVGDEETVLQPLYGPEDFPDVGALRYPDAGFKSGKLMKEWKLEDDEYFLMGDNRGSYIYSDDSREEGPVKDYMLMGKAYLITAKREIVMKDGQMQAAFQLDKIRMPWDYLHLDWH